MNRPFALTRVFQPLMEIALAPILVFQAWRTVRRTPRLAPAGGDEHGFVPGPDPGAGPAHRVVVIGESTAAGVGAALHAQALPGFLAEALSERLGRGVAWSVSGESGATAHRIATELLPRAQRPRTGGVPAGGAPPAGPPSEDVPGPPADLVVLTVGINDLIRRRTLRRWADDVGALIAALRDEYAHATLVVAGMPPVRRFPAIPQPLRHVLGARARAMDRIMRDAARAHDAVHVPMDEARARDRGLFAGDGFHPSPAGYRAWAEDLARAAVPARAPASPYPAPDPAPDPAPEPGESAPPADIVPPRTVN